MSEQETGGRTIEQVDKRTTGLENFNFLALLGRGIFSEVTLAEAESSKKLYAVKSVKKSNVILFDEINYVNSEKRMLLLANKDRHPFLLNLHACFQTRTQLFFLVDYVCGGDLMLHTQRHEFSLERTRLYAAEICLALKYLHENGIIHRNLKLSSILLDLEGHIKISDYRYCKEDMWHGSSTHTFCGTNDFIPPEVLLDRSAGYGRTVDWWAFGVLLYQMLARICPFHGDGMDEVYDAILDEEPIYPTNLSHETVSILQSLLRKSPECRLGAGPTDAQEIMSHAFFTNIVWEDVYRKSVQVPFKPTIKHPQDTRHFDQDSESHFTPVTHSEGAGLSSADQERFADFPYFAGDI